MMFKFTNTKRGQILIEVILALAITSMALVAVARIATKSISDVGVAQVSSDVKLVSDKTMDWIKEYKKHALWTDLTSKAGSSVYCINTDDDTYSNSAWTVKGASRCTTGQYAPQVQIITQGSQLEARVSVISDSNVNLGTLSTVFYKY
jgi:Tfp pilus assembly protein PilV